MRREESGREIRASFTSKSVEANVEEGEKKRKGGTGYPDEKKGRGFKKKRHLRDVISMSSLHTDLDNVCLN